MRAARQARGIGARATIALVAIAACTPQVRRLDAGGAGDVIGERAPDAPEGFDAGTDAALDVADAGQDVGEPDAADAADAARDAAPDVEPDVVGPDAPDALDAADAAPDADAGHCDPPHADAAGCLAPELTQTATLPEGTLPNFLAKGGLQAPDGSFYVYGATRPLGGSPSESRPLVIRLTPAGALDEGFLVPSLSVGTGRHSVVFAMALSSGDGVYVAGTNGDSRDASNRAFIARISAATAAQDRMFAGTGFANYQASIGGGVFFSLVVDAQGVLAGGANSGPYNHNSIREAFIVRYDSDGMQRAFDGTPRGHFLPVSPAAGSVAYGYFALYSAAEGVVAATSGILAAPRIGLVERLDRDGADDPSFRGVGLAGQSIVQDMVVPGSHFRAIRPHPDGGYYVFATTPSTTNADNDVPVVLHITSSGAIDSGFAPRTGLRGVQRLGALRFNPEFQTSADVARQSDGKLLIVARPAVVAGTTSRPNVFSVARLLPNGELDPLFGVDGIATFDRGGTESDGPIAIDVTPSGMIRVLGTRDAPASGRPGVASYFLHP